MIRGDNGQVQLDCSDRMSWVIACYVAVFVIDLLVGGSIVIWKCIYAKADDSECQLALAGTLGSFGIWFILLLGIPFLLVKFDQYNMCKGLTKKFKGVIYSLRGMRSREIIIHNRVYMPTTTTTTYCCKDANFNDHCKCSDETQIVLPVTFSVDTAFQPETEPALNSRNADFNGRQIMVYVNEKSSASVRSTLVHENS